MIEKSKIPYLNLGLVSVADFNDIDAACEALSTPNSRNGMSSTLHLVDIRKQCWPTGRENFSDKPGYKEIYM